MADNIISLPKPVAGTQTEKNLLASYFAESTAVTRYHFYAQQAVKDGYPSVGKIFDETAENELAHSKVFFKMLPGGDPISVTVATNPGIISDVKTNLRTAIFEEIHEGADFYMSAAATAREEGFDIVAEHFEAIATVERHHAERFQRFLKHIEDGTLWKRDKPTKWQCLVCGYIFEGLEPPEECPGCNHPRIHYVAIEDLAL